MAVPFHELGHRAPLDADAGADEGHLVSQVEEGAGPEPLSHLQLGRRLEQEDSLRPPGIDHVEHAGVLQVHLAQVETPSFPLLHEVQGLLDLVQHRQGEEVYLGEVGVGHAVLVPVHDVAPLHGSGPYGNHAGDGRIAQNHAPHVLAQTPGSVHQLGRKLHQIPPPR